jgi:hypothetical protein
VEKDGNKERVGEIGREERKVKIEKEEGGKDGDRRGDCTRLTSASAASQLLSASAQRLSFRLARTLHTIRMASKAGRGVIRGTSARAHACLRVCKSEREKERGRERERERDAAGWRQMTTN